MRIRPASAHPATTVAPAAHAIRRRILGQPPARKNLTRAGRAGRTLATTTAPLSATAASTASKAATASHPRAGGGDWERFSGSRAMIDPATYIVPPGLALVSRLTDAAFAARPAWWTRSRRPPPI